MDESPSPVRSVERDSESSKLNSTNKQDGHFDDSKNNVREISNDKSEGSSTHENVPESINSSQKIQINQSTQSDHLNSTVEHETNDLIGSCVRQLDYSNSNNQNISLDQQEHTVTHSKCDRSDSRQHKSNDKQSQLDPNQLSILLSELEVGTNSAHDTRESDQKHASINYESPQKDLSSLPDLVNSSSPSAVVLTDRKQQTDDENSSYQVKWIKFRNKQCAIITQNVNGPCPLLAILNVLSLRGKINLPLSTKSVTYDEMIVFLANFTLENSTNNAPEGFQLDYEQNINDAMQLFPKLQTGLDVNVQFNSITSFEYTIEMIIFDLLSIQLYHGWIMDKDDAETVKVIGNCSYNQLVDKIITFKNSNKSEEVSEALVGERFLETTASQLTYHGLSELVENVREQELSILFRNNHFITLYKYQNQLYQLVTDQGFLHDCDVVWMTLNHIDNDDVFVNHEFKPSKFKTSNTLSPSEQKKQIDQDYLLALSMEEEEKKLANANQLSMNEFANDCEQDEAMMISDEELARKLQEEENRLSASEQRQVESHDNRNPLFATDYSERFVNSRQEANQSSMAYRDDSQFHDDCHQNHIMRSERRIPNRDRHRDVQQHPTNATSSHLNSPSQNFTARSTRESRANSKNKCVIS